MGTFFNIGVSFAIIGCRRTLFTTIVAVYSNASFYCLFIFIDQQDILYTCIRVLYRLNHLLEDKWVLGLIVHRLAIAAYKSNLSLHFFIISPMNITKNVTNFLKKKQYFSSNWKSLFELLLPYLIATMIYDVDPIMVMSSINRNNKQ